MENRRTDTARDTDDSELIENLEATPSQSTSSGGSLARDVASEAELTELSEPDAETRVGKEHTIEHGTELRPNRPRA